MKKHVRRTFRGTKSQRRRHRFESGCTKSRIKVSAGTEWIDLEDDEDIFGTTLKADFCVETFNNCKENVLFKIYRDALVRDSADDYDSANSGVRYSDDNDDDNANSSNVESEDDWYAKDEIPKIEIVGSRLCTEGRPKSRHDLPRMQYLVIKELIDTEETYLNNMKHVIENYLYHFRRLGVSPNIETVFCNIEELHKETTKKYNEIKQCVTVEEIADIFLESAYLFECYTKYMRNKSDVDINATRCFGEIIKAREMELGDKITCESYLLNPVQRPGRYKLLLVNLEKAVKTNNEECERLKEAIEFVDQNIRKANTLMAIDSIQNCLVDLNKQGRYLMKNTFYSEGNIKREVFLFENCVVFCTADEDNTNLYHYVNHIEMDKLSLRCSPNSLKFYLASFDKIKNQADKSQHEIDLETPLLEIKLMWTKELQRILWNQLQYYKDLHKQQILIRQASKTTPDDDAYYNIEDTTYDKNSNQMSGTFLDKDKNVRIEFLRSDSQRSYNYMPNVGEGQQIVINELIDTEIVYLEEMKSNIDNYRIHCDSLDLPGYILENIENIYSLSQKLYSKLLECNSIESFAKAFLDNITIFDSYKEYMRNRETFCRYTNKKFENINNYTLNTQTNIKVEQANNIHLLNPLRRLELYKESLEELENKLVKVGMLNKTLNDAIISVNEQLMKIYTEIVISSITCCPIDLVKMGVFIMKETFKSRYNYNKVVFLFKDILILCTEDQNRPDTYTYEDSFQTKNLSIIYSTNSTSFKLRNAKKSDDYVDDIFTIETHSIPIKVKWINAIKIILWGQFDPSFKVKETDSSKTGEDAASNLCIDSKIISGKEQGEVKKRWKVL